MSDFPPIRTVSIIGAGVMGRGIALVNLRAGLRVLISDINRELAVNSVTQILQELRASPYPITPLTDQSEPPAITVVFDDSEIATADLILETITENIDIKSSLFTRIEPYLCSHSIVVTNSSSIPITRLAASLKDPSRFCGLHFCHPVSERRLVELVPGALTDFGVLSRVSQYATEIGMAPIVVRDGPGFLLNRILTPYLNEALELLLEGVSVEALDQSALEFGMPLGPLAHLDEFGIDVALAVGRTLYFAFPDRIAPSELLIAVYKSGRWGRKSGTGFYEASPDGNHRRLAPGINQMISERQRSDQRFTSCEITQRLFLPMLLEATRVLEEGLVESPIIVDTALRNGLGMTGSHDGLFHWADSIGSATILEWLKPLRSLGRRFEPTQRLLTQTHGG